jgi:hypothetical protein
MKKAGLETASSRTVVRLWHRHPAAELVRQFGAEAEAQVRAGTAMLA